MLVVVRAEGQVGESQILSLHRAPALVASSIAIRQPASVLVVSFLLLLLLNDLMLPNENAYAMCIYCREICDIHMNKEHYSEPRCVGGHRGK